MNLYQKARNSQQRKGIELEDDRQNLNKGTECSMIDAQDSVTSVE